MSTMTCTCQRRSLSWLQPTLSQMLKQYVSFGQSIYQWQTTAETQPQEILCDRISQLPPEIIRMILLHLLSTSHSSFLQALQVSRNWADIGTPSLWKNISLDSAQISRFTQSLAQPTHSTRYIQSLTLTMSMQMNPETDLANLSQTISHLEGLTTFSFSIHPNLFCRAPPISNLLKSVPSTVIALEIGRLPPRSLSKTVSNRVCHAIQRLLPQLEHLRIDRGHVCSMILPDVDPDAEPESDPRKNTSPLLPRLKNVLINDSNRSITSGHCCGLRDMRDWRTDLVSQEIALKARKLIDASAMPALESFIILTTSPYQSRPHSPPPSSFSLPSPPQSSADTTPLHQQTTPTTLATTTTTTEPTNANILKFLHPSAATNCFLRKDVLRNKTTIHPYCAAPHAQHKWVIQRPQCYSSSSSPPDAVGSVAEKQEQKQKQKQKEKNALFIGDIREIRTIPEGDKTWIETSTGARFPPSFGQTRQGRAVMGGGDHCSWIRPSGLAAGDLGSLCQGGGLQYSRGVYDDNDDDDDDDDKDRDDYDILTRVTYDGLLGPCLI